MPDNPESGAETPDTATDSRPKVRRVSTKRPKKQETEKPAPETESTEGQAPSANNHEVGPSAEKGDPEKDSKKRSNRRRRGKGKPSNESNDNRTEESTDESGRKPRDEAANKNQRGRLDPEKVANKAWKIFLAEVSEEGVALIGDNDARELSRRCFRLAELFIEEQQRRG